MSTLYLILSYHPGETPQLNGIEFETCSKENHCQAKCAKTSRQDRIQFVPDVARVTLAQGFRCRMHLEILRVVQVVKGVNKGCIKPVLCAFSPTKLTEVVRNVLEKDSNDKHSKKRGQ